MASGSFAEPIYQLIEECGSESIVLRDLIKYLSGDEIKDFVDHFRNSHDMRPANLEVIETESNDYVLCFDCQDTYHENESHQCEEIEYTDVDPQFFSSLIPEC